MLAILRILGSAYQSLCQYKCKEALQILHQLSPQQFETGWVQHQVRHTECIRRRRRSDARARAPLVAGGPRVL